VAGEENVTNQLEVALSKELRRDPFSGGNKVKPNTENEFAGKLHVKSFGLEANSIFPTS
jgi:hypothetical protein